MRTPYFASVKGEASDHVVSVVEFSTGVAPYLRNWLNRSSPPPASISPDRRGRIAGDLDMLKGGVSAGPRMGPAATATQHYSFESAETPMDNNKSWGSEWSLTSSPPVL